MRSNDTPRLDLTPADLGAAVQANLFELFRAMARLPGGELEELEGHSRHFAPPENPMFRGIWNLRGERPVGEVIDDALGWLRERGASSALGWLGPGAEPDGTREALTARGFAAWDLDAPGMAAELADLDWSALERAPGTLRIERVRASDTLDAWATAFTNAFEVPHWVPQSWIAATRPFGLGRAPWELYVGLLEDEPVATNLLFPGAGVAGVLAIGTSPGSRRRGIGAAITLAGCQDALERGYRHVVLMSTELGKPLYERLGFRETGAAISRYLWRAS
jgi:ribosomal protein S18 acetylase RimI-like enzyme